MSPNELQISIFMKNKSIIMSYLGVQDRFQIQMRSREEFIDKENVVRFVDDVCGVIGALKRHFCQTRVLSFYFVCRGALAWWLYCFFYGFVCWKNTNARVILVDSI
jgi:hypothetical protein